MRLITLSLIVCAALLAASGCNDYDPDFPLGKGGWHLMVDVGEYPAGTFDYPVFITISAQVVSLDTGANAPDGSPLLFSASDGTFENGLPEIEKTTVNGRTETTFEAEHPGRYEVTIESDGLTTPYMSSFTIGL